MPLVWIASLAAALVLTFGVLIARWLFCWRNFKKLLFGLACLVTLIALFYVEEDWRAKHAWEKFKTEQAAKGEKFELKDFVPPPVPDDQNFALTPVVASSYEFILDKRGQVIKPSRTNVVNRLKMHVGGKDWNDWPPVGDWQEGTRTDLKAWQDYYRKLAQATNLFPVAPRPQTPAQDVLFALSKYDSTIEALRKASKLPYSRFPLNYSADTPFDTLLPHLAGLKSTSQVLQLRAIAELQDHQSAQALKDVLLSLYLVNSIRGEPFLISHLVRIALTAITLQPVYEGLAGRQWSDVQLAELEAELGKLDFLADYEFSMRGERACAVSTVDYMRRTRQLELGAEERRRSRVNTLLPSAFFYRSELTISRMHERWTLPMADVQHRIVSPAKVRRCEAAAETQLKHGWPYNIFARMIFPGLQKSITRFAYEQSAVDLARTAIALERYRLAHDVYPETLEPLAPQFIEKVPHDIIDGGPLHYRRTSDGRFVLYSIGWNEKDDGGTVVLTKGKWPRVDTNEGDWVWRYPKPNS